MARITIIEQAIERLEEGAFQRLCNDFLSREGYHGIVALGSRSGSEKTTLGTPDTYFCEIDGKYIFVEYTTQQQGIEKKIKDDIEKCLDESRTGISVGQIIKIIYCHTSSNLSVRADNELKNCCIEKGIDLEIIGIDSLADQLYRNYPSVIKDHLGIAVDTQQIQSIEDYVKQYNSNDLSAPLNTKFQFRQKDVELIDAAFETKKVVILSGNAGVGKTRLAIEYANRRKNQKQEKVFCIYNRALPIYDDLQMYFSLPDKYFVVVDDANQLSELELVMELANRKDEGYDIHVLITVRQYALEKVKKTLSNIVSFQEISVAGFTDDEIKALVKEEFGIVNHYYSDRIADIAKGNARIAMLAGKTAADANKLESIRDVSQLYDSYYGKALREAHLDADIQLQAVAGVIAFLNSTRLDALESVLPVLQEQGIDADTFKKCAYELHDLELVDICRDTAVIISDQCFGDFILKYVFYDAKTIKLSAMIFACFIPFQQKTMQAINNLRNNFNNKDLIEYTDGEIKSVWNKAKKENPNEFWEYVKAFYPIKQEDTLLLIKSQIESIVTVEFSADQMDFENERNNRIKEDEILSVIGGFAKLENYESALDLYFMYFSRRHDLYMQFYQAAENYWGVQPQNAFALLAYLKKIIACSNDWTDKHLGKLFIAFAREQLRYDFRIVEPGKGNTFSMIHFSLSATEDTLRYREIIWKQLIRISQQQAFRDELHKLLEGYSDNRGYDTNSIIMAEAGYVCELLRSVLSIDKLEDCIIAEDVMSILQDAGANADGCSPFLENEDLNLYHLLIGPGWNTEYGYEEREEKQRRDIIQVVKNSDNLGLLINRILSVHSSAIDNSSEKTRLEIGIDFAVKQMLEDKENRELIASTVLRSNKIIAPAFMTVVENLITFRSNEEVKRMISNAPESTKEYCQFLYYSLIPEDRITARDLIDLDAYFREINKDSQIYPNYRLLHFLLRYEKYDQHIIRNVLRIIYQKTEEAPLLAQCYLPLLLHSGNTQSETIFKRLANDDLHLLRDIYLYGDSIATFFDCDGFYFQKLTTLDDQFLTSYTLHYLKQRHRYYINDKQKKYMTVFSCANYISKIDKIIQTAIEYDGVGLFPENGFVHMFILVERTLIEKSNEWIKHYIVQNKDDAQKERLIFETIAQLPRERKLPFYKLLLNANDDFSLFAQIPLTPSSYERTGSAVPIYKSWIEFLKDLNVGLSGIRYLSHKIHIQERIESIEKSIEQEEINNILEG